MRSVIYAFLSTVGMLFRSRLSLQAEIIALRHQLTVYRRSVRRPQIRPVDRLLWSWLSRHWARCREALVFALPATVIPNRADFIGNAACFVVGLRAWLPPARGLLLRLLGLPGRYSGRVVRLPLILPGAASGRRPARTALPVSYPS
jgi:hypothetical protein